MGHATCAPTAMRSLSDSLSLLSTSTNESVRDWQHSNDKADLEALRIPIPEEFNLGRFKVKPVVLPAGSELPREDYDSPRFGLDHPRLMVDWHTN